MSVALVVLVGETRVKDRLTVLGLTADGRL